MQPTQRLAVRILIFDGALGWFSKTFGKRFELTQAQKSAAVMFGLPFTYALLRTHSKAMSLYSSSSNASCCAYLPLHASKHL